MLGETHSTKHTECIKALEGGKDATGLLGADVAGNLLYLSTVTPTHSWVLKKNPEVPCAMKALSIALGK